MYGPFGIRINAWTFFIFPVVLVLVCVLSVWCGLSLRTFVACQILGIYSVAGINYKCQEIAVPSTSLGLQPRECPAQVFVCGHMYVRQETKTTQNAVCSLVWVCGRWASSVGVVFLMLSVANYISHRALFCIVWQHVARGSNLWLMGFRCIWSVLVGRNIRYVGHQLMYWHRRSSLQPGEMYCLK